MKNALCLMVISIATLGSGCIGAPEDWDSSSEQAIMNCPPGESCEPAYDPEPVPKPDLRPVPYYGNWAPYCSIDSDGVLHLRVNNVGTAAAPSSYLRVRYVESNNQIDYQVPALAAGASYTLSIAILEFTPHATVELTADSTKVIAESNENNNFVSFSCPVYA